MSNSKIKERRKAPRVKGDFEIVVADKKTKVIAKSINISLSGIYFQCNKEIPVFREVGIGLQLPHASQIVECIGVVVRSEKVPGKRLFNIAIFFPYLGEDDKAVLEEYIQEKLKKDSK